MVKQREGSNTFVPVELAPPVAWRNSSARKWHSPKPLKIRRWPVEATRESGSTREFQVFFRLNSGRFCA